MAIFDSCFFLYSLEVSKEKNGPCVNCVQGKREKRMYPDAANVYFTVPKMRFLKLPRTTTLSQKVISELYELHI